ncbi:hypothetical protein [Mesorhizobium sp. BR-1-1-10]|uniref:hypothetical protein n=1 Tax=Mesorhizobium sp. BR-1-1-10 TaxID=2876660 RepID=UPI001CD177F4|nr:hypothetical protein [Mesorhizobium sp. BR-1-1-10]MBZ9975503.1 hypothetical protein [Mesorhizobium sp. BR-1-1-10]
MRSQPTPAMPSLADIMRTAKARSEEKRWNEKVGELVDMIDILATERSPAALVEAVRKRGYNIEADTGMLERRGLSLN